MSRFRRWELQWIVKEGGAFSEGYGRRAYFLRSTAILAMGMHFMEYGHVFDYRLTHNGNEYMLFPGDLFA